MKVLLVDDHPLILSALQMVIESLGDHVEVVGVSSARAARETLECHDSFDLVLLDLQLGDTSGFDLLVEFRETYPALPVVVVSASDRASDVIQSIDLGAMGYVRKRASNDLLFEALQTVMSGGIYVPPMNTDNSSSSYQRRCTDDGHSDAYNTQADGLEDSHPLPSLASVGLTPRQTDVLALLLKGHANKMIARELSVSVETVKDHVAAVLRALGVSTRTQAVLAVSQMSLKHGGFSTWRTGVY
jgi:DNA-binding NarL/FixJ family response regulator